MVQCAPVKQHIEDEMNSANFMSAVEILFEGALEQSNVQPLVAGEVRKHFTPGTPESRQLLGTYRNSDGVAIHCAKGTVEVSFLTAKRVWAQFVGTFCGETPKVSWHMP